MKMKNVLTVFEKQKILTAILLCVFLTSCKSKQFIANDKASDLIEVSEISEKLTNRNKEFKTLYIKSDVNYKDPNQGYNFTADIRIEKDKRILVSIRFIGITMAKALITPNSVQYYEKMGNKYFEGDFTTLSKWLGTELDYQKVQNLLLGNPIDDLNESKFTISLQDGLYKLAQNKSEKFNKEFYFEASQYLLKKFEVTQNQSNNKLMVNYPNHQNKATLILPTKLSIEASQNDKKTTISMDYNTITVDENLSFPYSVPSGYDQITIEKN